MRFQCNCCGVCCKMLNTAYPGVDKLVSADGHTCKYLVDNKCSIYDHRPDFCNVDMVYQKYYYGIMSRLDFYKMNHKQCKRLRKRFKKLYGKI